MARLVLALTVFTTLGCRIPLDNTGDDTMVDAAASDACNEAKSHSDLSWIQDNIFTKSCAFSGCHKGSASNAGFLSLESGVSHGALVGQMAATETGWMRVVASNPSQSYLLVAMGAEPGPTPAGGLMPLANPKLCQDKLDAVSRWIMSGAQP
jgi:hypothetical protein